MHERLWLPLLLITVGAVGCQQYGAEPELVSVPNVVDGDTLEVFLGEKAKIVDLCGVDAPELDEPFGVEAREALHSLVRRDGGRIHIVRTGRGKDGATVAEAWFMSTSGEEEIHLNSEMLVMGMAIVDPDNVETCPNAIVYGVAEDHAKADSVGVWRE